MWRDLERGHFCLSSTCVFIWRHHYISLGWRICLLGQRGLFVEWAAMERFKITGQCTWGYVTAECLALSETVVSIFPTKDQRTSWKRGWKGCKSWRRGRGAGRCCLSSMAWMLHSRAHSSCWYPHRIKSTRSVNISAGSTKWTQWAISKQRVDMKEEGRHVRAPQGGREELWVNMIKIRCWQLQNHWSIIRCTIFKRIVLDYFRKQIWK